MHLNAFPDSQSHATSPFSLVHSDLKELPVLSYHRYKFFITFLDNFISYCWISLLWKKSDVSDAIDSFLSLVKNQYQSTVEEFMTDASSEYKSLELRDKLRKQGITIRTSIPHMHQQNGHAEHLNRTLIEKEQALHFTACLPWNWWEFCVEYMVHVYNQTPMHRHNWQTLFEVLKRDKPNVSHLRVMGCGAYIFILEEVCVNKLTPRAKLMTFLAYTKEDLARHFPLDTTLT